MCASGPVIWWFKSSIHCARTQIPLRKDGATVGEGKNLFPYEGDWYRGGHFGEPRPQPTTFECEICMDEKPRTSLAQPEACDHKFCKECMTQYIKTRIEERKVPIVCPVCPAARATANPFSALYVEQSGISEIELERFTEYTLAPFSVQVECARCKKSAYVDREEFTSCEGVITCPLPNCNYKWCKKCSQPANENGTEHSCDGSNELNDLMGAQGWKHCPGCQTPAEKISGCNFMSCTGPGCHTHFCYSCGALLVKSTVPAEIAAVKGSHFQQGCRL